MQVTAAADGWAETVARAKKLGGVPGFSYVSRVDVDPAQAVLIVGRERLFVRYSGQDVGWHRGLLHTRLEAGERHPLFRAMVPVDGETILDTTLGLGVDAAFLVRLAKVRLTALEASPLLAWLAAQGLGRTDPNLRVVCAESMAFLRSLRTGVFTVVYADPLFERKQSQSASLDLVREWGHRGSIDAEWLQEARRVASRCVVIKDAPEGALLARLSPERVEIGRRTRYGVWSAFAG